MVQNIGPNNWKSGDGLRLLVIRGGENHVVQNIGPNNRICYHTLYLFTHPVCHPDCLQFFQKDEGSEMNWDNLGEARHPL